MRSLSFEEKEGDSTITDSTVIPASVKAHVSLRIVPDQSLDEIAKSLRDHLHSAFKQLRSPNELNVGPSCCDLLSVSDL